MMARVRLTRSLNVPDPLIVSRYRKIPELGPRVLFFSGGSALTGLSRTLKHYTHNSIHLVTPFDSGGSSAIIRDAFDMPAVGDLRSRLMALADESVLGHPEVFQLFTYRLPTGQSNRALRERLRRMVNGKDPLVDAILNPMRKLIRDYLGYFLTAMPEGFDLAGASIGNLILAGGYLNHHRDLEPILFLFSRLVNVQGTVRAVVDANLHLKAELHDGRYLVGQHLITGKEVSPLDSPIARLSLCESPEDPRPATAQLGKRNRKLIQQADLICYPPGSFYSSLLANLLPEGVGRAIAANDCPKIMVPNLGRDPEQLGMTLEDSLRVLLQQLQQDGPLDARPMDYLNFLIVDSRQGDYAGGIPHQWLKSQGIEVIDLKLIDKENRHRYDEERLVAALLSLA